MQEQKPSKKPLIYYIVVVSLILLLLNTFVFPPLLEVQVREVGYDEFLSMVDSGSVTEVARSDTDQMITFLATDENG